MSCFSRAWSFTVQDVARAKGGTPDGAGRAERHTLHVFDIITAFDSNTFLISSAFFLKENSKPTRK